MSSNITLMRISYNWLKNYVDALPDPETVSVILTDIGLEVEGYEEVQSVKGGLKGLVIGEVMTKAKHPDADRLNLTTVNVGEEELLNIVCGAPNVAVGQKVVVATVGATLYGENDDSFKIKKSKIRGQLSEGMLCAEDEIGLGASHEGIMVLDATVKVGTLAADYFDVEEDVVYEIGLTPNRADAISHFGVARDLVTFLNLKDNVQLIQPSVDAFKVGTGEKIAVQVDDADLCPRYSGVYISDLKVAESPSWLKNRLTSIGLTPINNVVDVTNFVLHELGQPLHAFDAAKIAGNKVHVKTLADATAFTTLDGVERKLSAEDLMICNEKEGMCIAGVFGGAQSGVSSATTAIFLESAYFNPVSIRKTAKRHGLNTDASFRYERGADPNITLYALQRAACLLEDIAGGKVASAVVDLYPNPISNYSIDFHYANCDRLIGQQLDRAVIKKIISHLGIEIRSESEISLQLSVPPFKVDVQREVDVIEEVLRIYGYNNVVLPETMHSAVVHREFPDRERITKTISDLLVAKGYYEILTNSLTKADYYADTAELSVELKNPLSKELTVMRQSMLFGGLETLVYNQNRQEANLKLVEFGKTYAKKETGFEEQNEISLFLMGRFEPENWNTLPLSANFYHLKGIVNAIFDRFGLSKKIVATEASHVHLSYGLTYAINGEEIVSFGKVNETIQGDFSLSNEVFYASINFDALVKWIARQKVTYAPITKFPLVRRDLALLVDKQVNYHEIEQIAYQQERKTLKDINLFDVYEGDKLADGKKSYAVSFIFQDETKTMTDKQVEKIMSKIITALEKETGAQLR